MARLLFVATAVFALSFVGTVDAQERPGHMPDGRFEYRTPQGPRTLFVSDCQTARSGEVAGRPVEGTMLKTCRVRLMARVDGVSTPVVDVRTVLAWSADEYWWTEVRHGESVVHRIFIQSGRVLINRMTAAAEPAESYTAPRRR